MVRPIKQEYYNHSIELIVKDEGRVIVSFPNGLKGNAIFDEESNIF